MRTYSSLAIVALIAVLPASIRAQETASDTLLTVNHYLDWEQVSDPQLSPDGSQIIYTRTWVNRLQDSWESALWIMNADGSKARFLTKGSSARWSPDGGRIAYFADGEPKGTQVFVRWMDAEIDAWMDLADLHPAGEQTHVITVYQCNGHGSAIRPGPAACREREERTCPG